MRLIQSSPEGTRKMGFHFSGSDENKEDQCEDHGLVVRHCRACHAPSDQHPRVLEKSHPPGTGREASPQSILCGTPHTATGLLAQCAADWRLKQQKCVLPFWRPGSRKSRCRRGWFLLRAVRVLFQASLLCRGWLSSPCLLSLHHSVSKFPLLMRTPDVLDEDPPQ